MTALWIGSRDANPVPGWGKIPFWGPARQDARHPHPDFDTRRYLEAHPDVASSGLDPLVHYVLYGTAAAATS